MKYFFFIVISLLFFLDLNSEEKLKIKSNKYDNWFVECREINAQENCELNQFINIKDSNIKFKLHYSIFKNQDNEIKERFTIVTPLGVDLLVNPALRFDGGKQYNSSYIKCEIFGCIISFTNNTKNEDINKIFDELIQNLIKSNELEIGLRAFNSKPFIIKTPLKGFVKGKEHLEKKF